MTNVIDISKKSIDAKKNKINVRLTNEDILFLEEIKGTFQLKSRREVVLNAMKVFFDVLTLDKKGGRLICKDKDKNFRYEIFPANSIDISDGEKHVESFGSTIQIINTKDISETLDKIKNLFPEKLDKKSVIIRRAIRTYQLLWNDLKKGKHYYYSLNTDEQYFPEGLSVIEPYNIIDGNQISAFKEPVRGEESLGISFQFLRQDSNIPPGVLDQDYLNSRG